MISEIELEKEVTNLNNKILDFNNQKKTMVEELTNIKNKELNLFFENIKPVVQNYMEKMCGEKRVFIIHLDTHW